MHISLFYLFFSGACVSLGVSVQVLEDFILKLHFFCIIVKDFSLKGLSKHVCPTNLVNPIVKMRFF